MTEIVEFVFEQCDDFSPAQMRELAGALLDAARTREDAARTGESRLYDYLLHIKASVMPFFMLQRQVERERKPPPGPADLTETIDRLVAEGRWKRWPMAIPKGEDDYDDVDIGTEGDEAGKFFQQGYEIDPLEIVWFYDTTGGKGTTESRW